MAHRVLTFVVVRLGHLPAGRNIRGGAAEGLTAEQVRNEIGAKLAAMDAVIAQCEARFGRHVKLLDHPILARCRRHSGERFTWCTDGIIGNSCSGFAKWLASHLLDERSQAMRSLPSDRCQAFHQLHASGCFVIPNPWDAGSARALARLGFAALATTSSGFAWSLGRPDNGVRWTGAAHLHRSSQSVDVPVSADFEGGFAIAPAAVAANVARATATGIAGLSIEDSTGDGSNPLFDFALAVERIHAARHAIDESGTGALLTARSEGFIVGRPTWPKRSAG